MKQQTMTVRIVSVSYFCSSDARCAPTALVTIVDNNNKKRTIYLRDCYQPSLLVAGSSVILQEERSIKTRFSTKYTIWKNMAAYRKAIYQK